MRRSRIRYYMLTRLDPERTLEGGLKAPAKLRQAVFGDLGASGPAPEHEDGEGRDAVLSVRLRRDLRDVSVFLIAGRLRRRRLIGDKLGNLKLLRFSGFGGDTSIDGSGVDCVL